MTFIGIIAESKSFENIKEYLSNKEMTLIHINKKSIGNIKNIKFETIIIEEDLKNFEHEENIIKQLCKKSEYVVINTDVNKQIENIKSKNIITYGLNQKATVTVSSIKETGILIYLQKNIKNIKGKTIEVEEKLIKTEEKSKLKTYEIIIIYIIYLINDYSIIEQI